MLVQQEQLRISAKNVAKLALPDCCHRCFKLCLLMNFQSPFQIFPAVFGKIDRHTKKVVEYAFEATGKPPVWLKDLDIVKYIEPPSYREFTGEFHDVAIRGEADAIFVKTDGSLLIADYKTSTFKGEKDSLLPLYRVQLSAYALLAFANGLGEASEAKLLYFDPTIEEHEIGDCLTDEGLLLKLRVHKLDVKIDYDQLNTCLKTAKGLWESPDMPNARKGCQDCKRLEKQIKILCDEM